MALPVPAKPARRDRLPVAQQTGKRRAAVALFLPQFTSFPAGQQIGGPALGRSDIALFAGAVQAGEQRQVNGKKAFRHLPSLPALEGRDVRHPAGFHSPLQPGLEWAVEAGWVPDVAAFERWQRRQMTEGFFTVDLPLFARLYRACEQGDIAAAQRWTAYLLACRETRELREEERNRGAAFARLLSDWQPVPASWLCWHRERHGGGQSGCQSLSRRANAAPRLRSSSRSSRVSRQASR